MQIRGYYCTKKKCQVWLKHSSQQNLNVIPERVLAQLGMLEKIGSAELTDDTNFARTIEKQGYCITKTAVIFEAEQHFVQQRLAS